MSIDRTRPGTSAIDLIRSLSSASVRPRNPPAGAPDPAQSHDDVAALRARLGELVRGVDPDDPAGTAPLRRPVLGEILLWEFGSDFRQHPEFAPMLDKVEQSLEADPRFPQHFRRLLLQLQGRSP